MPKRYKNSSLGNIPKEWKTVKLGEVGKCIRGVSYNTENDLYLKDNSNSIRLLRSNNIQCDEITIEEIQFVNVNKVHDNQIIRKNDVLICMANGSKQLVGKSAKFIISDNYKYTFGAFMGVFRLSENNTTVNSNYIFYNFLTINYRKHIDVLLSGSSINNLKPSDIESIKIAIPSFPEQQKIAEILSVWDHAIEKQTKLIEKLETRKRALMQQLLTGKKRLKGFDGEWTKFEFDDIFQVCNAKKVQINKSNYQSNGLFPVIDQGLLKIAGYTNNNNPYKELPVIIFGDHTRIIKWIDFPFFPGADGTQLLKTKSLCKIRFGYYLLCNTTIPNLGYSRHIKELKKTYFSIPTKEKEQTAIAEILSSANREINLAKKKLSNLKEQKKGLMQVLLTGKKRVKIN